MRFFVGLGDCFRLNSVNLWNTSRTIIMHRVSRFESIHFLKLIYVSEYATNLMCCAGNKSQYLLT